MAFNWPISPTEGQIYTPVGGPTYVFNSPVWKAMGQGQIAIVSDSAPANPANGQLWWESDTGILFVYVNDGNSSQWVQCGGIQEASDLSSVSADMSIGFRTTPGNRFVVNDKADMTGTDVMYVAEGGAAYIASHVTSTTGSFVATAGNCLSGAGYFIGSTTNVFLGPNIGGTSAGIALRPVAYNSTTGQTSIDSAGIMTVGSGGAGYLLVGADFSGTGAVSGTRVVGGYLRTSTTTNATAQHHGFYNPSSGGSVVGQITTTNAATAYATSSDADLKDVHGDYDPQEAIAIIRADPVKSFTWKVGDGGDAVGWTAQHSHGIKPDLAVHMEAKAADKEGEPDEPEWWGIDYGKRTPYLWAAVTALLDEVEALKARIAVLEGGAS